MLHVITDTSQIQLFDPRLTYNFYIKGGFSGGEDYRWAVIRIWYPGWRWELFNWSLFVSWALMLPVDTARRIQYMSCFFNFVCLNCMVSN